MSPSAYLLLIFLDSAELLIQGWVLGHPFALMNALLASLLACPTVQCEQGFLILFSYRLHFLDLFGRHSFIHSVSPLYGRWKWQLLLNVTLVFSCLRILQRNNTTRTHTHTHTHFQIVVLEKTLESPLDCKEIKPVSPKGNQLQIFIGMAEADAEAPILWSLNVKANSLEKTLTLGKTESRRRGQQRMRWIDSITDSMDMHLNKLQEIVKQREAWHAAVHGLQKSWIWLSTWTSI